MTYTRVETKADVATLATGLIDPTRDRPWVVISTPFGETEPEIVIGDLDSDISDIARIFLIATGELTYEFSDLLPDRFQVYGGAGRSYPTGPNVFNDATRSKLRFSYGNPQRATEQLVTDALAHAHEAGLFEHRSVSTIAVTGIVKGFVGDSRAWIELSGGGMATVWQELTFPPVPLDWTLQRDQEIAGLLDIASRRMKLESATPTRQLLAERFPHNSVTLALVQSITAESATLALHPEVSFTLARRDISPNPLDTVTSLLSAGDVVAVRVLHRQERGIQLRMADVDDDEPILEPLSLLSNGPAWLQEDRALLPYRESEPTVVLPRLVRPTAMHPAPAPSAGMDRVEMETAPTREASLEASTERAEPLPSKQAVPGPYPGPKNGGIASAAAVQAREAPAAVAPTAGAALRSTQLSLQQAKIRIFELQERLATLGSADSQLAFLREQAYGAELQLREMRLELGTADNAANILRDELREGKRLLRESRRAAAKVNDVAVFDDHRRQFADSDEWIRHEIYLAWIERISPTERSEWPLPTDYRLGTAFARSLESLDEGQLAKVFKSVVDVLTGRIKTMVGRRLHALRTGDGANSADVVRDQDGARCMRASIEQNTPAARRLHYWQLCSGELEFSRIVTHDDMRP